jgi:hypothetical protein
MISVGDASRDVARVQKRARANETVSVRPSLGASATRRDARATTARRWMTSRWMP